MCGGIISKSRSELILMAGLKMAKRIDWHAISEKYSFSSNLI